MDNAMTVPQGQPLCCRYFLVIVETLSVNVQEEGGAASDQTLRWSFGMLASGEHEVLGAWSVPLSIRSGWQQVFDDLKDRGVEKIRFVSGSESAELHALLNAAYPGATVVPAVRPLQTLDALPPRYRRLVRASADAMQALQSRVNRAVGRHGSFSCLLDGTTFVMDALQRAERSIKATGVGGVVASERHLPAGTGSEKSRTAAFG